MTDAPKYTGYLRKDKATGVVAGLLRDAWGWEITLAATPDPAGGYTLTGMLGDVPDALRIPLLDGDPPA